MKYIVSGGGTGGHIYPAISIAKEILSREEDAQVLYIGTETGPEGGIVRQSGLDFETVRVSYIPRKISIKLIRSLFKLLGGFSDAKKIINDFKPNMLIGTGGYVSFPVLYMAQRKKIPTIILETNAYPGLANKFLAKKASAVCVTFDETIGRLTITGDVYKTGNPLRPDFFQDSNKEKYEQEGKLVLSFGGSGGQKSLNNALIEIIKGDLLDNVFLIHITGKRHYDSFVSALGNYNKEKYRVIDYTEDVPSIMLAADLVVASAGMMTLTEISAASVASILVPKAYTAENHQEYNARAYERGGASKLIIESDLNGKLLSDTINSLFLNDDLLKKMGKNAYELANIKANEEIYEIIRLVRRG
ncbi:MAG: UDP-N-acetylglucosamine--N-acetylmuramyl-(pentapeptide) pyrophosphoryl-undecaprenol N-acetylglucosamine transferase [Tissierellia bacterium]|nr:UDP-N-acetylglucosamine--N-acetylmuramyl-(pentapeptide) pyrophosphoryl-undecaprenol N-acetylglucosamine transferase [Tissierellia bacterium]